MVFIVVQLLVKIIVMDVVVDDVKANYGMLFSKTRA
jgi:hypothetical protein